jgi:hypothetical protein
MKINKYIFAICFFCCFSMSCDDSVKLFESGNCKPTIKIDKGVNEISFNNDDRQYLLDKYSPKKKDNNPNTNEDSSTGKEGLDTIEFPVEDRRRLIIISFDISGSMFSNKILFNGVETTLFDRNLAELEKYFNEGVFRDGDKIIVRLFGTDPKGGKETPEYKAVSGFEEFEIPKLKITFDVEIFERNCNSVSLEVTKIESEKIEPNKYYQDVKTWIEGVVTIFRRKTNNNSSNAREWLDKSPIIEDIFQTIRNKQERKSEKIFIYLTDGHFTVGEDFEFKPKIESDPNKKKTLNEIKDLLRGVSEPNKDISDPLCSVTLIGLYPEGNYEFYSKQESLFHYLLDEKCTKEKVKIIAIQ